MKLRHLLFAALTASMVLWGCAERNNPVVSDQNYALTLVSKTQTLGWAQDVWVAGNTAFVADGEQGISVWDVSNPASPVLSDTITTLGEARLIAYSSLTDLILVHERSFAGGVSIYKRSSKQRVGALGSGTIDGFDFDEVAADTIVIVIADRTDGLMVTKTFYDSTLNYWETAELAGTFQVTRGTVRSVVIEGSTVYTAHNQLGIGIIEVGFNAFGNFPMTQIGGANTPGAAWDLALNGRGDRLFVGDYQAGLRVVDVTNRNNPVDKGAVIPDRADRIIRVMAHGDTAYCIDQYSALYAIDCRVAAQPKVIAKFDLPTPAELFVRDDGYIFVADEDQGLVILRWR